MSEEEVDGGAPYSEMPSLLSYTRRYVSFAEVGRVFRVALREPMHLCTCALGEFPPFFFPKKAKFFAILAHFLRIGSFSTCVTTPTMSAGKLDRWLNRVDAKARDPVPNGTSNGKVYHPGLSKILCENCLFFLELT